jgi:hypothetical protein
MKHHETNKTPAGSAAAGEPVDHRQVIACLLDRQPPQLVDVAIDLWERLAAGLVVIIGNEGFDALYDRSLHFAREGFPWLTPGEPKTGSEARFACLRSSLLAQDSDEAGKATVLLFTTFIRVLVTLIGHPLTTNILRAAWGNAYETAAQEASQCPKK